MSIYINIPEEKSVETFLCEIDDSGILHVTLLMNNQMKILNLESILQVHLNNLLMKINNYLDQYGFIFQTFNTFDNNEVEILNVNYECTGNYYLLIQICILLIHRMILILYLPEIISFFLLNSYYESL